MPERIEIVRLAPQQVLTVRKNVPGSGLGEFFMDLFPRVMAELAAQGARPAGPPFSRYYNGDPRSFDVEAGVPFTGAVRAPGWATPTTLPGGEAAKTLHIGPYSTLSAEYRRLESWIAEQGRKAASGPWESYLDDNTKVAEEQLRTEVFWPIGE